MMCIHLKEPCVAKRAALFENSRSRRIRVIAAICAMVILAGSSAGVYSLRRNPNAKAAPAEKAAASSSASTDEEIISAGGTVTSAQLGESLCLENTSVRLSVEKVLVETGQGITAGTPICQLSTDSLQKAEKTLKSELQSAESALLEEKMSYQTDKNEAYLLYKSDLLLGETAQAEYDSGMKSLDSELNKAKAAKLYDFLDNSALFKPTVLNPKDRSLMNVPFVTGDKDLDAKFVKESKEAGLVNLKGHRTVGGMRASIYNAMTMEGVDALIDFMKKFETANK